MKPARIIVLGIAGAAAVAAALLMQRPSQAPETVVVERKVAVDLKDVLVATRELGVGTVLKPDDLRWQPWPSDYVPTGTVTRNELPAGVAEFEGGIVRVSVLAGEPVRREKIIKANSNAFMSAILPSGMRAVAISIDSRGSNSAGGFILPNDRVDILKTYREDESGKAGDSQNIETILQNMRVLAIGQNVQDKNGEKVVTGETATIEVTPAQAELLALAQKTGQLSLTLRSLADAGKPSEATKAVKDDDSAMTLVRYGVSRQASRR